MQKVRCKLWGKCFCHHGQCLCLPGYSLGPFNECYESKLLQFLKAHLRVRIKVSGKTNMLINTGISALLTNGWISAALLWYRSKHTTNVLLLLLLIIIIIIIFTLLFGYYHYYIKNRNELFFKRKEL